MLDGSKLRRWAAYASISCAALLIAVKLGAYLVTGSVAILSSLIDSSVDALASIVILVSVLHAQRPADRAHRFGHGKAEALAALAQAAFVTGSAVALGYQAIQRLVYPAPVKDELVGVGVMIFASFVTGGLVAFQRHVIRRTGSIAIDADSLHYRGDLLMNAAVVSGLLLAAYTGLPQFDTLFGVAIAGYLVYHAWGIGRSALDQLMDRELSGTDRRRIETLVMGHPDTRGMHDLRTRSSGNTVFIELHLEMDKTLTLEQAHDITDQVEAILTDAFPSAEVIVHQEPEGLEDVRLDQRIAAKRQVARER